MKITMLGTSGSGKTTYLSALLGILYDGAVDGFNITPCDITDAEINRQIEEINTLYSYGKFPDGTESDIRNLSLSLCKNQLKLVDFDFIDYRGGALEEIAKDENSSRTQELTTALLASDVALVFIDAIKFDKCKNIVVARNQLGVNAITTVLLRAKNLISNTGKKIKVVFVLTKTDASTIDPNNIESLKNRVKELYSNLYAQFGTESEKFTIYEISTVGRKAIQTNADWTTTPDGNRYIKVTNDITSPDLDFNSVNIISVLAQAFLDGLANIYYDVSKLKELLENKRSDFGVMKQIIDIVFHKSNKRREIFDLTQELKKNQEQLSQLKQYKGDLQRIIINKY